MDTTAQLQSLLVVFIVAAITPLIVAILPGPRLGLATRRRSLK